jgi:uncharacterized membrane protein
MITRKIFGYIFIVVSIILILAIVGQFAKFLDAIVGIIKIFSGQLNSYQIGQVIGIFIYWMFHISLTIFLWTIGRRWTKYTIKNE